jgi:MSHA biogenesis protein MshQ
VVINNININTLNSASPITYTDVPLNFGNDQQDSADFVFTYPDAGMVQLHARYNIPDEYGNVTGNYMLGSSNNFVVRPFGFFIDVIDNPKAQSANQLDSVFIAAGEEFATRLTAVQWQVDGDTDLSNNPATLNFGKEQTPAEAKIIPTIRAPSLAEGDLTNKSFTNFNGGVAINGTNNNKSMTYSEVGIVNFDANLSDLSGNSYLGTGDITGNEPYVGRFIPDHFELTTGLDGSIISVCDFTPPSSDMEFAYVGQMSSESSGKGALQYEFEPKLLITAKSKADLNGVSSTTENYTGDFIKFIASDVKDIIPTEDAGDLGALGVTIKLLANIDTGTLPEEGEEDEEDKGVITYVFNVDDNFVYLHEQNAETIPFPAKIELGIESLEDSDEVVAIDGDNDTTNGRLWTLKPTGKEIRFGRAYLENSFGPETSDLPQVLSVEYFDGENFVLADDDTCTPYNSVKVSFGSNEVGLDPANIPAVSGTFVDVDDLADGITRKIVLPAAGEGEDKQGKVEVTYGIYDWLKYDWNGVDELGDDLLYDDNPSAIATFGLFRGNDRIIYQREVH